MFGPPRKTLLKRSMSTASTPMPTTAKASPLMVLAAPDVSLHRHRLGQVARPVDVVAVKARQVVCEKLERDDVDAPGRAARSSAGVQSTASACRAVSSSPSFATRTTVAPRDFTSEMFASIFSRRRRPRRHADDDRARLDESDGPVLELAGRVSLRAHVRELLQLEGTLHRDGVADVAPEVEEVPRARELLRDRRDVCFAPERRARSGRAAGRARRAPRGPRRR